MIAIPVDSASPDTKSSALFGNVPMFALCQPGAKTFHFVKNDEAGNGIKTAKQLKRWGVKRVVYTYLGDGPFGALRDDGVGIYYIGKTPMALSDIVDQMEAGAFVEVTDSNADAYLDPGTNTGTCECGCSH
jgi:predicted Fe-Mo cluster-binding NifX family protein